ncbi:MAG: hypothetical protein JSV65_14085 [Armatimonadota bacterium]|nr:MAG: hypothetical protein JSV65_14085 [Armatimonadota bacterium]
MIRRTRRALLPGAAIMLLIATGAAAEQVNGRTYMLGEGADAVRVIEVWGSPYEMGYAHGYLVRDELKDYWSTFFGVIKGAMGATDAQLDYAWDVMSRHISDEFKEEIRGLAEGADVPEQWARWMHIIPDLSWITCSYYAAWGKAVPDDHLYQIRALDYWMEAHVQDKPAIIVWRPSKGYPLVTASWIGFVGVITGMNAEKIAISEIGDSFGEDQKQLDAEPWVFMARRVLQYTDNLDDAIAVVRDSVRPSSYDYLIGDGELLDARQMTTGKTLFKLYDWRETPHSSPPVEDVVYTCMEVKTDDWNESMHQQLLKNYGNLTAETGMGIMKAVGTGDLHAVAFDVTGLKMWVANAEGPGSNAFDRSAVVFDLGAALKKPVE